MTRPNLIILAIALMSASAHAADEQSIALDTSGPRLTAQLTIDEQPSVTVIFDTGAGGSVLTAELGKMHKLPNEGTVHIGSPGGQKRLQAYLTTLPKARLGEVDITGQRAVVGDLGVPLPGISGVMSPNLFRGSLVRFELKKARALVTAKSSATIPTAAPTPYHGDGHALPAIEIDIAGTKLNAHLDTGSGRGLSLPLEIAKQIKLKAPLLPAEPAKMVGGVRSAFLSRIDGTVRIGPLSLVDPEVTFIKGFVYVNVGFSILKDVTVVLDPAEQRSWLLPAE